MDRFETTPRGTRAKKKKTALGLLQEPPRQDVQRSVKSVMLASVVSKGFMDFVCLPMNVTEKRTEWNVPQTVMHKNAVQTLLSTSSPGSARSGNYT